MEDEKQTFTAEEVEQMKADLIAKHNSEMASQRKKYDNDLAKAKMSAEELAKTQASEEKEALENELKELRSFKKEQTLKTRLEKEGLPSYFKNDSRLLNATDEKEIDSVLKTIKTEYGQTLPKGATHSTVVNHGKGDERSENSSKNEVHSEMNNAIRNAFGFKD